MRFRPVFSVFLQVYRPSTCSLSRWGLQTSACLSSARWHLILVLLQQYWSWCLCFQIWNTVPHTYIYTSYTRIYTFVPSWNLSFERLRLRLCLCDPSRAPFGFVCRAVLLYIHWVARILCPLTRMYNRGDLPIQATTCKHCMFYILSSRKEVSATK